MYRQKESYKRDQLLAANRGRRRRDVNAKQSSFSITFQTSKKEGLLFHAASGADFTTLQVSKTITV